MLSILAIAMAGVSFWATRDAGPQERRVEQSAVQVNAPSDTSVDQQPAADPTEKPKPTRPAVQRGKVMVEIYNNSGITGLAGQTAGTAQRAGWRVTGTDNWYGTIPTSTVYYPARLKAAAKLLGLDLGITRVVPSVGDMRSDRLTVILTDDAR